MSRALARERHESADSVRRLDDSRNIDQDRKACAMPPTAKPPQIIPIVIA
jgi:hypothetical protein